MALTLDTPAPIQGNTVHASLARKAERWRMWLAANAGVALAYFALGFVVSIFFAAYGQFPAPIWLPTAVAVVASLSGGVRLAPGIFVGAFLANALLLAPPLPVTLIVATTGTLGPLIGALVLRRMWPENGVFRSFAGVSRFLLCMMLLSPAISATGGTIATAIQQHLGVVQIYATWVGWWLCDAGGTLYLAPALLLWLRVEGADDPAAEQKTDGDNGLLLITAIAVFTIVLFLSPPLPGNAIRQVFPYLLVVPLAWVALRLSLRSAFTLISLIALIAATGTLAGFGAFRDQPFINPLQMVGSLVILLAMDVLTTVALVSELQNSRKENRVKSMFLATTSHELRSPLNAILGFSSLIGNQNAHPIAAEKYSDYGQMIHSAGEHLLGLINGLLDLSKMEAGQFPLAEEDLIVAEVVDEAVALCRLQAESKSIALSVAVEPEVERVRADPKALRQVLLNLLSNAIKFTPEGGRVDVGARLGERGDLIFSVKDTGVGIPKDAIERVFTPFERVHRRSLPDAEGTGLGLSITRGLVLLHGGAIRLDSEPGQGTEATVTLPSSRLLPFAPQDRPRIVDAAD